MSMPDEGADPEPGAMRFRRSNNLQLNPDGARRQGEITRLAFLTLGRERAIDFLNNENTELGARPLDLAIASPDGRDRVEAALGRLMFRQPED